MMCCVCGFALVSATPGGWRVGWVLGFGARWFVNREREEGKREIGVMAGTCSAAPKAFFHRPEWWWLHVGSSVGMIGRYFFPRNKSRDADAFRVDVGGAQHLSVLGR